MWNPTAKLVNRWILVVALATIGGCEMTSHRVGQSTSVQFGVVQSAQEVTLDSHAAEGALIGGTIGLLAGSGRSSVGTAIAGAAVGGAATAVAEGDRSGIQYTVRMTDGSTVRIVSDQREIRPNDCVAVERGGRTANIRRTSEEYCQPSYGPALSQVNNSVQSEAAECQAAKQELVEAQGQEAIDMAARKVHLLCNS